MRVTTVNLRTLLPSLLLPAVVGGAGAVVTAMGMEMYQLLAKPPLVPPGWVFGVVWTVLYLLMGYAAYLVKSTTCFDKQAALQTYYIQLALNFQIPPTAEPEEYAIHFFSVRNADSDTSLRHGDDSHCSFHFIFSFLLLVGLD